MGDVAFRGRGWNLTPRVATPRPGPQLTPRPYNQKKPTQRDAHVAPDVFDNGKALSHIRQRARRTFTGNLHVLEQIAAGTLETTVSQHGTSGKSVTTYRPSARDRMQALKMLADYGYVPSLSGSHGEGSNTPADVATMTRAVVSALSDPAVRAWLMQTMPELKDQLAILSSVPAEVLPDLPHGIPDATENATDSSNDATDSTVAA